MGKLHEFEKEKMIVGVIYHDPAVLEAGLSMLTEAFGPFDLVSEEFSFSKEFSNYYDEEIGGEGLRRIYSFENLVDAARQAEIKTLTNEMEKKLSVGENRKINLDPGFMNIGRVMLATTKPAYFRIPLSDGIFTEMTLFYARGAWQRFPWTYRDYQSPLVHKFLTKVHKKYLAQRKEDKEAEIFGRPL